MSPWPPSLLRNPRALAIFKHMAATGDEQTRFSLGFLATRAAFAHLYTTAAAQAPPNDAPTLSTRSPSSESPVKALSFRPKTSFFHPLHHGVLKQSKITHVVSVISSDKQRSLPSFLTGLHAQVDDVEDADLARIFPKVCEFIEAARQSGGSV